ncbi:low molecular weight protein arginine phosphatase [Paenibacillus sp. JX-17]|uniref:Low molecular weight protein arginine phosphatase n=1 Tax=Paenibacillus lacisoli TaxID=3064525 RepID=A0ABT9CB68_9BACL|nr:low molecular weight protein arginine phosphatase [Paenibacillus sp. JX-17]MDO7906510.1 low molecular weight protein arginine phosphatase [Paenibacillus sp. JX-17]
MNNILFVCTGNTCRSPMAEALLRKLAGERKVSLQVRSAGVAAAHGGSISRHAEAVLRDHDIQEQLTSKPINQELVEWADLILTLTQSHKQHVLRQFPQTAGRIYTLKEYAEDDAQVLADIEELDSLRAGQALQQALGRDLDSEERERMVLIRQRIPSFDISDPFGGFREDYDRTAGEIRTALERLLDKLEEQQ